jgi:hypothetical protein
MSYTVSVQTINPQTSETLWDSIYFNTVQDYLDVVEAIKQNSKVFAIVAKDSLNKVLVNWTSCGIKL